MALRCFIAVEIPEPLKQQMAETADGLKRFGADVRWVPAGNVHLTLKFLGATEEALVARISDALSQRLSSYSPFYIKITGVGCFPDMRRPRVIWAGIEESKELMDLAMDVESEMVKLGYAAEDRAFSPHLTIGRVRSWRGIPEMMKSIQGLGTVSLGSMEIRMVTLMKSELRPAGAEYSSLAEIPFGGRKDVEQG
ncbi:MAG: RNA 2',3'-cyclic phosphodiesterase [Candidatus Sulfobium sp.]|jgi:RNA 2',3'-cyclic 3'-phosphodiesterase